MATRTKAQFEALYGTSGTTFPDNIVGSISEGDLRDFGQDIADSVFTTGLITTKVTIPSASILTAFTTPVTLISAQGAGTVIEMQSILLFYDYNSVAYATNTSVGIDLGSDQIFVNLDVLGQTSDRYYNFYPTIGALTSNNRSNQPLTFTVRTGNPTAGNSPLYLYLTYRVITL